MTTTETTFEAGVYDDMPEDTYHADPVPGGSLSSTGARKLLPPGCPAKYRWERDHPVRKDVFEFGTAAHSLVLGKGKPLAWIDAKDWRTNRAKEFAETTRAKGAVPLLRADHERVQAMAAALREHPLASALLCRDDVTTERSYFWQDQEWGIWRRARFDAFRQTGGGGRLLVTDYKTTTCAEPGAFAKSALNYGYHQQAAWYLDALLAFGWGAAFLFVAQEKEPPYLVSVAEMDADMLRAGDLLNQQAMEIFRDCSATDIWPGYQPDNDIALLELPAWARPREDY